MRVGVDSTNVTVMWVGAQEKALGTPRMGHGNTESRKNEVLCFRASVLQWLKRGGGSIILKGDPEKKVCGKIMEEAIEW